MEGSKRTKQPGVTHMFVPVCQGLHPGGKRLTILCNQPLHNTAEPSPSKP
jgi:hypothetical protein